MEQVIIYIFKILSRKSKGSEYYNYITLYETIFRNIYTFLIILINILYDYILNWFGLL